MRYVVESGDAVEFGFDVADELMRSVLEGGFAVQFALEGASTALARGGR